MFMLCRCFDIEFELGMFICGGNEFGSFVVVGKVDEYIFGYVLMNDWSVWDIQVWEYVFLGLFILKNVGISISFWVVLVDVMEFFKIQGIFNDLEILLYLKEFIKESFFDINFEVNLISKI